MELVKAATVYFSDLDDFGKGVDIKSILKKYAMFFEGKFTVNQIISAIHAHCVDSTVIPKVAHITAILAPAPAQISRVEYMNAQDKQKRNNFPIYSPEAILIREFEAQESKARDPKKDAPMSPLLANRLKAIGETPVLKTITNRKETA